MVNIYIGNIVGWVELESLPLPYNTFLKVGALFQPIGKGTLRP